MIDEVLFMEQTNAINTKLIDLQKQLNRQKKSICDVNYAAEIKRLQSILENSDATKFDETLFKTIVVKIKIYSEYKAEFELLGGFKFIEKLR
jgi:tRNA splicing endonuclease